MHNGSKPTTIFISKPTTIFVVFGGWQSSCPWLQGKSTKHFRHICSKSKKHGGCGENHDARDAKRLHQGSPQWQQVGRLPVQVQEGRASANSLHLPWKLPYSCGVRGARGGRQRRQPTTAYCRHPAREPVIAGRSMQMQVLLSVSLQPSIRADVDRLCSTVLIMLMKLGAIAPSPADILVVA